MYNTQNPAELYPNTTWELLVTDKYLKTTTGTPLSTGGSNNFTIQKINLPAEKLQIESFSAIQDSHNHKIRGTDGYDGNCVGITNKSFTDVSFGGTGIGAKSYVEKTTSGNVLIEKTKPSISSMSPYTTNMGSGTAIPLNPTYITVRAWKRLT